MTQSETTETTVARATEYSAKIGGRSFSSAENQALFVEHRIPTREERDAADRESARYEAESEGEWPKGAAVDHG